MPSHYGYGKRKELQVAEFLRRRGFALERAQASRGPVDLIAKRGSLCLAIQVKATRRDFTSYTRLRVRDETRLIRSANARKARPTLALVVRNNAWFLSVPDKTLIGKGKLRPLHYEYPGLT